mmetsp:Transcript_28145/g.90952  ORF Transcript_28145/g.90952 Transcript_28145/m.90952 type:complete len:208 (-) Transcript_28145:645-1268(-)
MRCQALRSLDGLSCNVRQLRHTLLVVGRSLQTRAERRACHKSGDALLQFKLRSKPPKLVHPDRSPLGDEGGKRREQGPCGSIEEQGAQTGEEQDDHHDRGVQCGTPGCSEAQQWSVQQQRAQQVENMDAAAAWVEPRAIHSVHHRVDMEKEQQRSKQRVEQLAPWARRGVGKGGRQGNDVQRGNKHMVGQGCGLWRRTIQKRRIICS